VAERALPGSERSTLDSDRAASTESLPTIGGSVLR
jgi:hypothetical protein